MDRGDPNEPSSNGEAITGAFTEYRDRLVGTAYFVLGNREDAREAVQEAFVKCWRRRADLRTGGSLKAWIFAVTMNAARDLRRRRTVRRAERLPVEECMPPSTRDPAPAVAAERREMMARVRASLLELPEREREVFLLRQNGDFTYQAISELLGAPVGTVKTRMRSALIRLRACLGASVGPEMQPRMEPGR